MSQVLASGGWKNNAEMIADVARLGYLDGTVLDATWGLGRFWSVWKPEHLVTNDLYQPADFAHDFRRLPFRDGEFDAVVFDPPYKLRGTPALGEFDAQYGLSEPMCREDVHSQMVEGAIECYRVARRFLLVKCMDMVEGGKIRWQTDIVTRAIEDVGGEKVARFILHYVPMQQPPSWTAEWFDAKGKRKKSFRSGTAEIDAQKYARDMGGVAYESPQLTAANNFSTLLVFKRCEYAPRRLV